MELKVFLDVSPDQHRNADAFRWMQYKRRGNNSVYQHGADLRTLAMLSHSTLPQRCFLGPAASCSIPVSSGRNLLNMPSYGLVKWKNYSWYDTTECKRKAGSWGFTHACQKCSLLAQGKKRGLVFIGA